MEDDLLAEYGLIMKRTKWRKFVSATVVEDENVERHTPKMLDDVIKSIVGDVGNLKQALLNAGRHKLCVDKGGILYSAK